VSPQNKTSPTEKLSIKGDRHGEKNLKSLIPHVRSRYNLSPVAGEQQDTSSVSTIRYQPKQLSVDSNVVVSTGAMKVVTPVTLHQFQSIIKEDIALKSDLAKYYSSVQSPGSAPPANSSHEKSKNTSVEEAGDEVVSSDDNDATTDYSSDFVVPIDLIKSPSTGTISEGNDIQSAIDLNQIVKRARAAQALAQTEKIIKKEEDEIMFRYRLSEFQRKTNNLPPYDCVDLIIGDMHSPKFKSFLKKEA